MPRLAREPSSWRCPCGVGWRWAGYHEINFGKSLSSSILLLLLFWLCSGLPVSYSLSPASPPACYPSPKLTALQVTLCIRSLARKIALFYRNSFHSIKCTGWLCITGSLSLLRATGLLAITSSESHSPGTSTSFLGEFYPECRDWGLVTVLPPEIQRDYANEAQQPAWSISVPPGKYVNETKIVTRLTKIKSEATLFILCCFSPPAFLPQSPSLEKTRCLDFSTKHL